MKKITILHFILTFFCIPVFNQETSFIFPDDAGLIDVTKPPYNADKTGNLDATTAIQAALEAYPNANRTIYFPNGTYLISNTLEWPEGEGGNTFKRTMIQGESTNGVIIKLSDNCNGFQNPSARKAMIYTGPSPAQRFRNAIRAITVNTGSGNPGACGIQFNCSNEGTIQHVRIISGDGQGIYGLDLDFTDEIGPGYIYDLTVEGFNYGIRHGFVINSMTFEKITLRNQNVCGFWNGGNVSCIRGLTSFNNVTAVRNQGTSGTMILIDAELNSLTDTGKAIFNSGVLYTRNVHRSGYNKTIDSENGFKNDIYESMITEYNSHGLYHQFHSPATGLNLPIKDWPEVPWSDLSEWANVRTFGAVGDNNTNDASAIQAAIDAGRETVYFPGGYIFKLNDTIKLRGNVKRMIGCETWLTGNGVIVIEDGIHDTLVFERITAIYSGVHMINKSSRTLVINSVSDLDLVSEGSGDLFLVNYVVGSITFNNPDQHIWVRQINPESGSATNIINNGATCWILGMKTERGKTKIHTKNGGKTELLGSHNYSTTGPKTDPWFIVENASFSAAGARETNFNGSTYTEYVKEIRDGETKTINRISFPNSAVGGSVIPLYTGYVPPLACPESPSGLSFLQVSASDWILDWDPVNDTALDYYSVYISALQGGPYSMIANYLKETELIYKPAKYATYYFIVSAVNQDGMESEPSDELAGIVPQPAPPLPPTGLTGTHSGDSILLTWNSNGEFEFDHYELYKALPPGTYFIPIATNLSDTTFADTIITANKTYYYVLRAVNTFNDKSVFSDTTIIFPVGLKDYQEDQGLVNYYPNPAGTYLHVQLVEDIMDFNISFYNMKGELLRHEYYQKNPIEISLQGLNQGIYWVEVFTEKWKCGKKLILGQN